MGATIGAYLIRRLADEGVGHVFGVPGDYSLTFFKQLEDSPLQLINTCDEQGAGFAADAYARLRGIGAACVTYRVGGLKIANAVAQAYGERSPLVLISARPEATSRAATRSSITRCATSTRSFGFSSRHSRTTSGGNGHRPSSNTRFTQAPIRQATAMTVEALFRQINAFLGTT